MLTENYQALCKNITLCYETFIVTTMLKMILIYFSSFGVTVIRFQIRCV